MKKYNLNTADAAKSHGNPVQISTAHRRECPFCKCTECSRAFSKRGEQDWRDFTKKEDCTSNNGAAAAGNSSLQAGASKKRGRGKE